MSKLKVGDRVRVYSVHTVTFTGRVDSITNGILVGVIEDGFYSQHGDGPFHVKQCRKLMRKKRREWWVVVGQDSIIKSGKPSDLPITAAWPDNLVFVREARGRK